MKKKIYLFSAFVAALAISSGIYAYTYFTAGGTLTVTELEDIATCNATATQPNWDDVLETELDTETLRPNAAGNYAQCDPIGDTANYLCVDEATPDEDTTYVRTWGGVTELDTYNIDDHSEGKGTVDSVTIYNRTRATSGTHASEVAIRTNSTDHFGSYTTPLPTSYSDISAVWTTNPDTTDNWTWDEIDALEIGVRHYDLGTGYLQTTQVYADVDYEYLPLTGDVPTGDLFEIMEHPDYSGELIVRIYLTNTGSLVKAYDYLNMELYLEDSVEPSQTLTLENGLASFTLKDPVSDNHTLSVTGGVYGLVSDDMSAWEGGWTVTPGLYCEVTQR